MLLSNKSQDLNAGSMASVYAPNHSIYKCLPLVWTPVVSNF